MAHLGQQPGWEALRSLAKERMEKHFDLLAREFAMRGKQPDFAELQWHRGFFSGMKFLLDNPTLEARKLEKALAEEREDVNALA